MPQEIGLLPAVFRVDPQNECLWRGQEGLPLTGKAFAVLGYLIAHPGHVVTKQELLDAIWPQTYIGEAVLPVHIGEIRKVLGDEPHVPQFIETVHRRGYRFIGIVTADGLQITGARRPLPRRQAQASRFVGREKELGYLRGWLEKALRGERLVVFVTGEPGIGKTTLVDAFLQQVGAHENLWIGRGQCIEHYGAGEAYLPVLESFGRLCRQPGSERMVEILRRHGPTWLMQMPALITDAELEAVQRKVQGATRDRMLHEMAETLEVLTAETPLILIWEDLQWSDYSSLDLLSYVAQRRGVARLLVIGTYRPADLIASEHPLRAVKQELHAHGQCEELPLQFFTAGEVTQYLSTRFPQHQFPPAFAQVLYQSTDGNPLFLVTIVNDMVSQGVVSVGEERWTLNVGVEEVEVQVPASLRQLLEKQIEQLTPEEQRVLESASVAGVEFSTAAVAAELEKEVDWVEERCEGLERHGQFLASRGMETLPDGTVAERYRFFHALYQNVLYDRLGAARRRHLHRCIGEWEEAAYGTETARFAAELATHFTHGGDPQRAVRYLVQAADNAFHRCANHEAIAQSTTALDLLDTHPDLPDHTHYALIVQRMLTAAHMAAKGFAAPEVAESLLRGHDLWLSGSRLPLQGSLDERSALERVTAQVLTALREFLRRGIRGESDRLLLFPGLMLLGVFRFVRGDLQTAHRLGEQCVKLATKVHDEALLLTAHALLGMVLFYCGQFTAALDHLEFVIARYDRVKHGAVVFRYSTDPGVIALAFASMTAGMLGYLDAALRKSQAAIALAREVGHPFSLCLALGAGAVHHQVVHEWQGVKELAEEEITIASKEKFPFWLARATILEGWVQVEEGHADEGIKRIRQGLKDWRATWARIAQTYFLALLAEAHQRAGQIPAALDAVTEGLQAVDKIGERIWEAELYRLKGVLLLQSQTQGAKSQGEQEAEGCFQKAIAVARQQQAKVLELRAVMSLNRLWQQQGKRKEARQMLAEIYSWFTEGFDRADLQEAKALLAELA